MKRKFRIILVLTLALVMLLSACQPRDLPSNGDKKTTSAADSESGDEQNPSASPTSIGEIKNWKFGNELWRHVIDAEEPHILQQACC
jgi:hypothetical protein